MFQRKLSAEDSKIIRDKAEHSLKEYRQNLIKNYQDYQSQNSEQINDIESVSKPSIKSMPVRTQTKDLLIQYQQQLNFKTPAYIKIEKKQIQKQSSPNREQQIDSEQKSHQQSVESNTSHKNPFESTIPKPEQQQELSFSKQPKMQNLSQEIPEDIKNQDLLQSQSHPFENSSSVLQLTQTNVADPFIRTISDKYGNSQFASVQESSNIQALSQSQDRSVDSQQFYQTFEENNQNIDQQFSTPQRSSVGIQKTDPNIQSSYVYNSIKEEINAEQSNYGDSSFVEESRQSNQPQSPECESLNVDSYVEHTERWGHFQQIPQSTAQFIDPNIVQQNIVVQTHQQEQQIAQSEVQAQSKYPVDPTIQRKLTQELVVDMDQFGGTSLLKSINQTQFLQFVNQYFEQYVNIQQKQLSEEFKVVRKLLQHIQQKKQILLHRMFRQLINNKEISQYKQERERRVRQFRFSQNRHLMNKVIQILNQNVQQSELIGLKVDKMMSLYRKRVLLNRWKYKTYTYKMKKSMDQQYLLTLFNSWRKVAKTEKKSKDIKALTFYYYSRIKKHFRTLRAYSQQQLKLRTKYVTAYQSVNLMRKNFYLQKLKEFVIKQKQEKELESYTQQANEYIPIQMALRSQRVKLYQYKPI